MTHLAPRFQEKINKYTRGVPYNRNCGTDRSFSRERHGDEFPDNSPLRKHHMMRRGYVSPIPEEQ